MPRYRVTKVWEFELPESDHLTAEINAALGSRSDMVAHIIEEDGVPIPNLTWDKREDGG